MSGQESAKLMNINVQLPATFVCIRQNLINGFVHPVALLFSISQMGLDDHEG